MKSYWLLLLVFVLATSLAAQNTNLLTNPGVETRLPAFWATVNDGLDGSQCIWATDTTHGGTYALKVVKASATAASVGYMPTINNATTYWNRANGADGTAKTWNMSFWAKTQGVNTAPASDDARIGVLYQFFTQGTPVGEQFVTVDQTVADKGWSEYAAAVFIAGAPDSIYLEIKVNPTATGTVWFDDINCNVTEGWAMGVFNGNCETPQGWMNWTSSGDIGFANVVSDTAHDGTYSVLLQEDDALGDEMVFYSRPVPVKTDAWYKVGVWIKTEDVNTDTLKWYPTNVVTDRINDRIAVNFFYHATPYLTRWDLVGGDQFFYLDQRNAATGWTHYTIISQAPDGADGMSMRARFNPDAMGKAWYDDFSIEEIEPLPNLLTNPGVETRLPAFWATVNDGLDGSQCIWATDTTHGGTYALKVVKASATAASVGYMPTINNATTYWNRANGADGTAKTWNMSFWAKTEGVNTAPASDDARIGVLYQFFTQGTPVGEQFVTVDQTVADKGWSEYAAAVFIAGAPDSIYLEIKVNPTATGTVWFDDINCNVTEGWAMGVFNGNCETPQGWMNWTSSGDIGFANVVSDTAHDGTYSVLLQEDDALGDEMVFYSRPVPVKTDAWYKVGVWIKTEDVNTDTLNWYPTNIVTDRINDRIAVNFFYHATPYLTRWDLVGGDQFFYLDQRNAATGWTHYTIISQAPDGADGMSMRARFNPDAMGKAWYDDFNIQEVNVLVTNLDRPVNRLAVFPVEYELYNNYPNPFNPETIIEYKVSKTGRVHLAVFNVLGQKVRTLIDQDQIRGVHRVMWDGKDENGKRLSSGIYFYQLRGDNALITKKMTLIK